MRHELKEIYGHCERCWSIIRLWLVKIQLVN